MTLRHTLFAAVVLASVAAVAAAQSPDHDKAAALIGPMMQEVAPGRGGEVFTVCVVAQATPEEIAALAAAPGPSEAVGTIVTAILNRPDVLACAQQALAG